MSATITAHPADSITTWPTDYEVTASQREAVLDIATALAVGGDPEAVDFKVYDAASHIAPVKVARPLVVLAGIKVEHDPKHDEHARLLGQGLGELIATIRVIDYAEPGQSVRPHSDVEWLIENVHQGVVLPHLAADDKETRFVPEGHTLSLDSEVLRIVGVGIDSRSGRETVGVPLPSGLEARESLYRVRMTAV